MVTLREAFNRLFFWAFYRRFSIRRNEIYNLSGAQRESIGWSDQLFAHNFYIFRLYNSFVNRKLLQWRDFARKYTSVENVAYIFELISLHFNQQQCFQWGWHDMLFHIRFTLTITFTTKEYIANKRDNACIFRSGQQQVCVNKSFFCQMSGIKWKLC